MQLERRIALAFLLGFLALSVLVRAADPFRGDDPTPDAPQEILR